MAQTSAPAPARPHASSCRLTSSGFAIIGDAAWWRALAGLDAVLRGIGQVMLQNNSWAGLLFLVGVFLNSTLFGWAGLSGAVVGTATAWALGMNRDNLRAGHYGFNGALTAVALVYFFTPSLTVWCYVGLAAVCATIVMAAMQRLFKPLQLPPLTAPFVLVTLGFMLADARFGRLIPTDLLPAAELPTATTVEGAVTVMTVSMGTLNGIAQIFLQENLVTGVCFVAGLLLASRRAAVAALLGSITGLLVTWVLGAAEPGLRAGVFGFNSALVTIALMDGPRGFNLSGIGYGLLAAAAAAVAYAGISAALQPVGMPALTLPFVVVVWVFQLARPGCTRPGASAA